MRILWLVRYPPAPPANGGDAVYSRYLIEHTAKQAEVDALTFDTGTGKTIDSAGINWRLIPYKPRSKVISVASPLPNIAYRHDQPDYCAAAIEMAAKADAVVIDHVGLFFLVDRLRTALGVKCPPLILIHHDHEGSLRTDMVRGVKNPVFRTVLYWDGVKAGKLEKAASIAADGITAITTTDQDAFRVDAPATPSVLMMPGYNGPVATERTIDADTPPRLCILGGRGAFHKRLVLQQILDRIVAAGLQKRFIIDVVGGDKGPNEAYPGVNFLGFVDDIEAYLRTVRVGLIPDDIGGGFKVRALTHTFLRVPMLALEKALAGTTLRPDVDYIAAQSLDHLIALIPEAVENTSRLNNIQNDAFDFCKTSFNWDDRATDLLGFIETLKARKAAA